MAGDHADHGKGEACCTDKACCADCTHCANGECAECCKDGACGDCCTHGHSAGRDQEQAAGACRTKDKAAEKAGCCAPKR